MTAVDRGEGADLLNKFCTVGRDVGVHRKQTLSWHRRGPRRRAGGVPEPGSPGAPLARGGPRLLA